VKGVRQVGRVAGLLDAQQRVAGSAAEQPREMFVGQDGPHLAVLVVYGEVTLLFEERVN
jgi:hypothetical protein